VTAVSSGIPDGDCTFSDLDPSSDFYSSTCYLYKKGVLSGSDENGKMSAENLLKRAHLAKIAFRGVYSIKERSVPSSVVSDNFPTVYSDLTDKSTYYFQAAKALMYLEYGDGVTPFDRDRFQFAPEESITRLHTLKVLMETFNIQPDVTGTNNPFPSDADVTALKTANPKMMGYVRKAASLGIITTDHDKFRPYDNCKRGEAFVMLARIMQKVDAGSISDPHPDDSDYFQPLNITLKTIALGLGLPMGNFQHYTKTSFSIDGTVPLLFAHNYNSYNTTLPEVFFGVRTVDGVEDSYQPLGPGWSHTYHSYLALVESHAVVHWGGGSIDVYESDGTRFVPMSIGVYDEFEQVGNEVIITTKKQVKYHFSKPGGTAPILYLRKIEDRNGNILTVNYSAGQNGFMRISSVSDGQRSLFFSYMSGTNLISSVRDPLGRSISFDYKQNKYTGKYQLSSFTDAKGQTTTYDYEDDTKESTSKLLSRIKLPKGNYIENEYDANHRLNKTVSGIGSVPTTQTSVSVAAKYGSSVSTTSQVDVKRDNTTSSYNYTFNANNVVTKLTGEEGLQVTASYSDSSHPQLPTSIRTNNTNVSNVQYDDKGNVTSVTVSGDGTLTTKMTYDSMNNLTSVTDARGNTTNYTYDSNGNLTDISAPEGRSSSISYNSKGLPTEIVNPMGVSTTFTYNSYGNLTKVSLPALSLSSTSSYDAASRMISSTDALNRTTKFDYDENDNLLSETDPANNSTSYDYDKNDNLISITNAKGGVTTLSYDNATDWLKSMEFGGATKRFTYNDDGTLNSYTKPDGTRLNYQYDDLGRVTYDGVNSYSYDSKLRLESVSGNGKTMTYTYDGFNRITGTSCDGHSNSYSYDENGNCLKINNTSYTYDNADRMKTVKFNGKTITYTYRKDNKLSKVSYPNGMTTTYDYDEVGRLTSKKTTLSNGTVVASYSFTLDKEGNITSKSTQEPYSDIKLTNETVSYSYNSDNRITKAGDISFSFDENGNTTKRGDEQYRWDKSDRLTRSGSTNIDYDPLGLIASYGDIEFTTNPLGIGTVLSDSKSGAEYIYGNGLEARVLNGKTSYYVTDFRGSVVAIVDDNNNITHKYQYDEFGKVVQQEEADFNPFKYVGGYGVMYLNDHLYYMRARHYDPTIGRFLSEDPIWSTNLYPYADNNPIMGIDPEGLRTKQEAEQSAEAYKKKIYWYY
jgi:RHS repeat-associated protein